MIKKEVKNGSKRIFHWNVGLHKTMNLRKPNNFYFTNRNRSDCLNDTSQRVAR